MKQPFIFAMLAATWVGTAPVQAQNMAADLLPPYEVSTIVASMGMRPLDRPVWRNGRYVVNAIDRYGREVRVVLDARDGQVIAVRPRTRDYVYEPRYAPAPPPAYPRSGPYEPRYDQRYDDAPSPPPAAIPGRPSADDDDEFFDDDRQQGSLMPPSAPPRAAPPLREVTTGSVPRRITAIPPSAGKGETRKSSAPLPRSRPAVANANPAAPKTPASAKAIDSSKATDSSTETAVAPAAGQSPASDKKPADKKVTKPEAKEVSNAKPATPEAPKAETPNPDVRVIDMSKPKPDEKAEDKPGEAIRF